MKAMTVAVSCSECGKVLRGIDRGRSLGFHVRRHMLPNRKECWGSKKTNHTPVVKT